MAITYTWKVNNGLYTYITDPSYLNDSGVLPEMLTNDSYGYIAFGEPDNDERQKMQSFVKRYFTGDTGYDLYKRFYSAMLTKLRAYRSPKYKNVEFPSAYDSYYAASCDVNYVSTDENSDAEGSCKCCYYNPEGDSDDYTDAYKNLYENHETLDFSELNEGNDGGPLTVKYEVGGFTKDMTFDKLSGMSFTEFVNILLFTDQVIYPSPCENPSGSTTLKVDNQYIFYGLKNFGTVTYNATLSAGKTYSGSEQNSIDSIKCVKNISLTSLTVNDTSKDIESFSPTGTTNTSPVPGITFTSTASSNTILGLESDGYPDVGTYVFNVACYFVYQAQPYHGENTSENPYMYPTKSNGEFCDYSSSFKEKNFDVDATWSNGGQFTGSSEVTCYCVYPIEWNIENKNINFSNSTNNKTGSDYNLVLTGSTTLSTITAKQLANMELQSGKYKIDVINPLSEFVSKTVLDASGKETQTGLKIRWNKAMGKPTEVLVSERVCEEDTDYKILDSTDGNYYLVFIGQGVTQGAYIHISFDTFYLK